MVRVRTLPFWSLMVFPSYSTWPSRATCDTLTRRKCTWTTWSSTPRSPTPPEWPWPGESSTPSCQQHTSTPRRSGRYWDFMSFRAIEDWSCRKKNLQRKFEVICAETAPFEDIFFVFSELIISKFTSYTTLQDQVSPGHNFSQFPGCCASWWRAAPPSSWRSPWRRGRGCGAATAPPTPWWVSRRRSGCELKCNVQSPTQTEREER